MSLPAHSSQVLLIDDDPQLLGYLQEVMEFAGYGVTTARNGLSGLESFRRQRPDLVLTDIVMPDMEGIALIREIRALDKEVPIIAMSGGGRGGQTMYLEAATKLGANAALHKPFSSDELFCALNTFAPLPPSGGTQKAGIKRAGGEGAR